LQSKALRLDQARTRHPRKAHQAACTFRLSRCTSVGEDRQRAAVAGPVEVLEWRTAAR
jgi:hypothetical protein